MSYYLDSNIALKNENIDKIYFKLLFDINYEKIYEEINNLILSALSDKNERSKQILNELFPLLIEYMLDNEDKNKFMIEKLFEIYKNGLNTLTWKPTLKE